MILPNIMSSRAANLRSPACPRGEKMQQASGTAHTCTRHPGGEPWPPTLCLLATIAGYNRLLATT